MHDDQRQAMEARHLGLKNTLADLKAHPDDPSVTQEEIRIVEAELADLARDYRRKFGVSID